MITIRPATENDLQAIRDIYNDAVAKTVATFDTQPQTVDDHRKWFAEHGPRHPVLVAEEDGRVIGWASVSQYSGRCAYDGTAEASLYVEEACRGRGVGRQLLEAIIAAGRQAGLHTIISRIGGGNDVSVHLHEAFGFETIGIMREVGFKFGRYIDVVVMQLIYR